MSNEELNKTDGGQSSLTVGLGIADRLREWIPDGDGYNSEYANTLREAADEIDRHTLCGRVFSSHPCRLPKGSECPDCGHGVHDFNGPD